MIERIKKIRAKERERERERRKEKERGSKKESEGEQERERERQRERTRRREKETLLKEMTPSWLSEPLHWPVGAPVLNALCCQRCSQRCCLAAPRGKLCWSMLSINSGSLLE